MTIVSTDYFFKGLLIGFSVAAPVGPIGVLTIRRTLTEGRLSGFVTGLGAAMADALYGVVACFGISIISSFLLRQEFWLALFGGLFLLYIGVKSVLTPPATTAANINSKGLARNFIGTFFLTVSNPTTILSFLAIFAGLGLASVHKGYSASLMIVVGVFLGSAFWWLFLSSAVAYFRTKITSKILSWINKLSGLMIVAFGLLTLLQLIISNK